MVPLIRKLPLQSQAKAGNKSLIDRSHKGNFNY